MSNKPPEGYYTDHVAKIDRYVTILCGPAMERDGVTPLSFRNVRSEGEESVFKFTDTMTSRAEIGDLARLFKDEVVAIIGLGGTGSYVLDFIVKTPVARIIGFDRDPFHVHNAFRSPGRLLNDGELDRSKAEVYQGRYENFREGLELQAKYVDESCTEDLKGVTFAFVCVDKGSSRREIFDLLMKLNIPFIDVGLWLDRKQHAINGTLRATYFEPLNAKKMRDWGLAELSDRPDDEYRVNVQIAELNALNACLAVVRYKQLKGFYLDENNFDHMLFKVNDIKVHGEAR
jgi:ThiF family